MKRKKYMKNRLILSITILCLLSVIIVSIAGCRSDASSPLEKIESIVFNMERASIKINEEMAIRVIAKSDEAKKNEKIEYASVNEGIIEIREATNDGFIIKGLKGGSTVITAKSENVTSYFEVVVESDDVLGKYILVSQPVIEMLEGERKSTQVSLYGGSVLDNNDFAWRLENSKNNISIDVTANIAVISGLQHGNQKIIVSHEKAEFEIEILVFVRGMDEVIQYISCDTNVIFVPTDGQYHNFSVTLINGKPEDTLGFQYEVTEGGKNIEKIINGNVCNILGVRAGTSVIKVTHPLAPNTFEVRVVIYDINVPFITLDQTFVLLNIGESVNILANVQYAKNEALADNEFSYEIIGSKADVVDVIQTNNYFYIRGQKGGNARLIVSNEQTAISREVLVIVRDEIVYRDDYYITTTQNVIMTQVGESEIRLNIQLVNGNNADANSFEWVIDDGNIINVESAYGVVRGNRAIINSVFNAIALITPKKAGTAKIIISHPKAEANTTIMVKVYPRGTFAEIPINVGALNPDGTLKGLLTVKEGQPETIQLNVVSGDSSLVGNLNWSTSDANIARVNAGAQGLVNILTATGNGLTKMTVKGEKLEFPYEPLVMAGTVEGVVIYVDNVYQKMVTDQVVRIEIKDSNNSYGDSSAFSVAAEHNNVVYAVMVKSQLLLQGRSVGETKVKITHPYAINDIIINVRVDPAFINIDKPYYLSGPDIVGLVRNKTETININLTGAGANETGSILWSIEDTTIASIIANGQRCDIIGKTTNKQTKIHVSHPKSENEKMVLVYVVENERDLYNKVAIGTASEHYLLTAGDEKLITLITNASDSQKAGLTWKVIMGLNTVITIQDHFDSAMICAVGSGHAEIQVSHKDNIMPLTIFISVVEAMSGEKLIQGPAVIELLNGESKIVSVNHKNLDSAEIENISWSIEDSAIANIRGNGDSAYILGLKKGVSYIKIRQDSLGYRHQSTLLCANTPEELASLYVMGVDTSYYSMMIGEEKRIRLAFGSAGFPETAKNRINWTAGDNGVVRVSGQGESVSIIAMSEGVGTVTVKSDASYNDLELTFDVYSNKMSVYEFRGHDKFKGVVVGNTASLTMRMFNGDTEITNGYSLLHYENEDEAIISLYPVDNVVNITAKKSGQSYITIRHPQVQEAARILVYTANTAEELDMYYPVVAEKANYLLQVGEQAVVRINTLTAKDTGNLQKIVWGIENAGVLENLTLNAGQKETIIKGKIPGQAIICIYFDGKMVDRIFINVVSNDQVDMTKYIVTENIIGIVKGETRQTEIFTNLTASEAGSILWTSLDNNIVTVNGSGTNATITAKNITGVHEVYVTVSYGSWLKRHILVYVCDNSTQLDQYKAMNMENQYIRLGRNETITLPVFYAPNKSTVPTMWVDRYDNKVVRFREFENGGKIELSTLNEGVAVLEAYNSGLSKNDRVLQIYIEVSDRYSNVARIPELRYLTTTKTVYILNPDTPNESIEMSVNGIGMNMEDFAKVQWTVESGSQFIRMYPNGKDCTARANTLGLEGEALIKVYYVDNIVYIKIIVSRNNLVGFPHIAGEDIVRIGFGEKQIYEYTVAEISVYDKNGFSVSVVNGTSVVAAKMTGNVLEVEGKSSGQALLRINHINATFSKEVIVIVTTTPDGLLYLTTNDNFSVIKVNEFKLLNVSLMGFENAGDTGYTWTLEPDHRDIISIHATGRQAQVQGKKAGTAKITITHELVNPMYRLVIYVRVSNIETNMVYITSDKNIVSVIDGRSAYIQVDLINGKPEENTLFVWNNVTPDIISVEGAGNQVVVLGRQPGIGRLRVSHTSALNSGFEILVIVERDTSSSGIYITTDSALLDLKPNDTRQISVRLVGGNPEDIYGFAWKTEKSNPILAGKDVLRLVPNADGAFITGLNEGEATIRVTHPKTSYVMDITVYVRLYSKITFKQRSVTVDTGKTVHVNVECPAGVSIYYAANDYYDPVTGKKRKIVNISGTNDVCVIEGIAEGVCIVSAFDVRGTMSDEIVVEVKKVENRMIRYIQTPDVIYNMTDWQSALNRMMISGKTIGQKDNGQVFTDVDDTLIRWEVVGGKDVIGLGFNDPFKPKVLEELGKSISVYTTRPGIAEITATHKDMPEYKKSVYMHVVAHNENFQIDPMFISMQIGDQQNISAFISNLPEVDYKLVEWSVTNNENGIKGIRIAKNDGNKQIWIEGIAEGLCQVRATYNKMTTVECSVYVEKRKTLTVERSYVTILPDEVIKIPVYVEPADQMIYMTVDEQRFLDGYPVLSPGSGNKRELIIKGARHEGLTRITLTANYIDQIITVYTNFNYIFRLKDISAVRGQPGDIVSVKYDIYPRGDKVVFKTSQSPYANGSRVATQIGNVDIVNNIITLKLDNCGYTEFIYDSDYNKTVGKQLEIPIYVYYTKIDLQWTLRDRSFKNGWTGAFKTRIDSANNAIYLGDGEIAYIDFVKSAGIAIGYPGSDVKILNKEVSFAGANGRVNAYFDGNGIRLEDNSGGSGIKDSSDKLITAEYIGLLTFEYSYSNGSGTQNGVGNFQKSFMVFREKWARK
jgi:hypothetical protein